MRWLLASLLAFMIAAIAGCHKGPTAQEKEVMAQFSHSMKPQCIGRYLIDLPESFHWVNPDLTLYYGRDENFKKLEVKVVNYDATLSSFEKEVDAYARKVGSDTLLDSNKSTLISKDAKKIAGHEYHAVMLRYYDNPYALGVEHQLHLLVGHVHVVIKGASFENVEGMSADADKTAAVEARMLKLASEIRPVDGPEKAGPGFCLGSVVVDSNNDYDDAILYFAKNQGDRNKKVGLEIISSSFKERNPNTPSLIQRGEAFMSHALAMKTLKKGKLTLGGMPAEEMLTVTDRNGKHTQLFVAETSPADPSLATPKLRFELLAGRADGGSADHSSSLTDNEAVALWDAILKTLRPRIDAVAAN
jgi:hypothetical protein